MASAQPPVAPSASQALPTGTRLAEFEIQAKLGEGGFGIVYRAWDHSLGQLRAIKEYMPGSMAQRQGSQVLPRGDSLREPFEKGLQRFIEEAQTLARFDHPSLVRVLRRWEANGTAYMAMPLYEGQTLRERVRQLPEPPAEAWLLNLLAPLTEALAVVHQNRWLHRDIAPDNIFLLQDGRPLLLDFGAARQVIGDVTQELTAVLKPGFAPVEQYGEVPGGLEQGPWTDVYALAATLHWAILGRSPLPSVTRVLVDKQVPLVEAAQGRYSERLLAALDKALRVDARQRTQNMAELRADLGLDEGGYATTMPFVQVAVAPPPVASTAAPDWPATEVRTELQTSPRTEVLTEARTELMTQPRTQASPTATQAPPTAATATRPLPLPPTEIQAAPVAEEITPTLMPVTAAPAPVSAEPIKPMTLLLGLGGLVAVAAVSGWLLLRPATAPDARDASPALQPATQPVAATASAPAPAPAPARFDLDQQWALLLERANAGYGIELQGHARELRIGRQDELSFTLRAARDGYLTVLVRGPDGSLTQLFADRPPLRVRAGESLRLPPADSDRLQAAEPVGREDVVVIVSAAPRDFSALAGERQGSFLGLKTGAAAEALLRQSKLGTPLLLGEPGACSGSACVDFGAAAFSVQVLP